MQGTLRRDEDNRVSNFDQYAQGEWHFAEDWQLSAGVRASRVRFRSADNFLSNGSDSGAANYSAVTPVGGLVYHLTDAINLYASVGKGFETPTFNELAYRASGGAGLNFDLRPARSLSYEVGGKLLLSAGTQLNIAAFHTKTTDEIVVLTNSGGRSTFQNAGRTTRIGFEAGFVTAFTKSLALSLSAATVRATYDDSFLTCAAPPPACTTPTLIIPAGSRIPGVPQHTGFAELTFKQPGWLTAFDVRAVSRVFVNDQNSDRAPGYAVASWRLVLDQTIARWTISEFVRIDNLFDRKYSGSVIVNEGNSRFFEPAPGRHYLVGASAQYRF